MSCQFITTRSTGANAGKSVACGRASVRYRCEGALGVLVMELCDRHAEFCRSRYHWTVTAYTLKETDSEVAPTTNTKEA